MTIDSLKEQAATLERKIAKCSPAAKTDLARYKKHLADVNRDLLRLEAEAKAAPPEPETEA